MAREMKDSGVEWIGEIPREWRTLPLGNCFLERIEKVSDKEWEPLSVTKKGIFKQLENVAKSDAHDSRKKVCKGDFVINSRSDRKQSCGLSDFDGSVSLINIVLKNIFYKAEYTKYLLKNDGFAEEFYRWGSGIVADLWSTKYSKMKKIILPVPSLEEQEKIANYLDKKVSDIDLIIEKTRATIEDYKKYKQSIITEAVTKGINPNVEMKDSGVEWIGEVPREWEVKKLKYVAQLNPK
ncbi:restriction endonuclease subunit S, partial [Fusobacterium mortiferum]|uniref:restriction endonuclease subunit S n=1 Tax=Fusobacterium mortiferum TaxID=850 RepID=UPI00195D570E|nr:restriction endonuclease subunit S [Fusobacterium mortiferum]